MRLRGRPLNYILVDGRPVPEDNILAWGEFMEDHQKRVLRQDFFLYRGRSLIIIDEKTYNAALERKARFGTDLTNEQLEQNLKARKKKVELGGVPIMLSTIFLGLDHNHALDGPPILWETMMFGIDFQEFGQHRHNNAERALKGHTMLLDTLMRAARVGKLEGLLGDAGVQGKIEKLARGGEEE